MVTLAPAYEDPHMISCHMVQDPGPREYARQRLWQLWDELAAERSVEEGDVEVDEATVDAWAPQVSKEVKERGNTWVSKAQMAAWLADPAKWTPWIDDIAVARALQFDWDVIENLTVLERREFIARLAVDPWRAPKTVQPRRARGAHGYFTDELAEPTDSESVFVTQRDANWRKGTKMQRHRVRGDVYQLTRGRRDYAA